MPDSPDHCPLLLSECHSHPLHLTSSHTATGLSVTVMTSTKQGALAGDAVWVCFAPETSTVWTQPPHDSGEEKGPSAELEPAPGCKAGQGELEASLVSGNLAGLWPAPPVGLQEDCVLESMLCEQETLPRASPCLVDPRRAGNSSLCTAFMRIRKKAPLAPGGPGHKQKASWLSAHPPLVTNRRQVEAMSWRDRWVEHFSKIFQYRAASSQTFQETLQQLRSLLWSPHAGWLPPGPGYGSAAPAFP